MVLTVLLVMLGHMSVMVGVQLEREDGGPEGHCILSEVLIGECEGTLPRVNLHVVDANGLSPAIVQGLVNAHML